MAKLYLNSKEANAINNALAYIPHAPAFVHEGSNRINKNQCLVLCEALAHSHDRFLDDCRARVGSLWMKFQR